MDLTIDLISQRYKEWTSSIGVESIIRPFFLKGMIVNLLWATRLIDCSHEFENIVITIEVSPHNLTILGIVAAGETLFTAIVKEGDTSCSKGKSKSTLKESLISISVEESGVVMIINKKTKGIDILEGFLVWGPPIWNGAHWLAIGEDISNWIVHRVVEKSRDIILIVSNITIKAIEALSHLEDSSWLTILLPEVFGNLWNGINSNSVKSVLGDKIVNPIFQILADKRIALVKIR